MISRNVRIAISGKSGCGNTTVGKMTAERLGLRFINWTFRNLARKKHLQFEEALALAQIDDSFDREVDSYQVELARREEGCVLSSRLAIWLLEEADLKVYLYASPETRTARIVNREGGDFAEKARFTETRDRRDHDRYLRLYHIDNDRFDFADLIIDTDTIGAEEVVNMIIGRVV